MSRPVTLFTGQWADLPTSAGRNCEWACRGPVCATFEDDYKNAVICDALRHSAESGQRGNIAD